MALMDKLLLLKQGDNEVSVTHFISEDTGEDVGISIGTSDGTNSTLFHFDSPAELTAFACRLVKVATHHEDMMS